MRKRTITLTSNISIHAPREGSDLHRTIHPGIDSRFQSTLPVRGATKATLEAMLPEQNFNPRSP